MSRRVGPLSDGTPTLALRRGKAPLRPSPRSFAGIPGKAIEVLVERGYTACEIDFATGFWMDYPWAEEFGKLARRRRIALSVHAPIAGFMGHVERDRKHGMATGMLDHSAGIAKVAGAEPVVFHPGFLLGRTRESRRSPRSSSSSAIYGNARGQGARRSVRRRDHGPRPRLREPRRRDRHLVAPRLGAACNRFRPSARDLRRRVHDGEGVPPRPLPRRTTSCRAARRSTSTSRTSPTRTATRRSISRTARARSAPSRSGRLSPASHARRP